MTFRFYTFVNHIYMSEKQFGIQTAHAVSTLMNEVAKNKGDDPVSYNRTHTWAEFEPTIIMCQGGNVAMLTDLYAKLKPLASDLGLPCVKFHEDAQSLGGVITCVGVLVPQELFDVEVGWESLQLADGPPGRYEKFPTFQALDGTLYTGKTHPLEHEFLTIVRMARLA